MDLKQQVSFERSTNLFYQRDTGIPLRIPVSLGVIQPRNSKIISLYGR